MLHVTNKKFKSTDKIIETSLISEYKQKNKINFTIFNNTELTHLIIYEQWRKKNLKYISNGFVRKFIITLTNRTIKSDDTIANSINKLKASSLLTFNHAQQSRLSLIHQVKIITADPVILSDPNDPIAKFYEIFKKLKKDLDNIDKKENISESPKQETKEYILKLLGNTESITNSKDEIIDHDHDQEQKEELVRPSPGKKQKTEDTQSSILEAVLPDYEDYNEIDDSGDVVRSIVLT